MKDFSSFFILLILVTILYLYLEGKATEVTYVKADDGHNYLKSLINDEDIHLIEHKFNRGLAESIRDLFEFIANNAKNEDIIIRMDGDATHNPDYIIEMVEEINKGYDVVVASRIKDNDKNLSLS